MNAEPNTTPDQGGYAALTKENFDLRWGAGVLPLADPKAAEPRYSALDVGSLLATIRHHHDLLARVRVELDADPADRDRDKTLAEEIAVAMSQGPIHYSPAYEAKLRLQVLLDRAGEALSAMRMVEASLPKSHETGRGLLKTATDNLKLAVQAYRGWVR